MIPFICRKPSAKAPVFSSPGRRQFSASLVYATTSSLKSIALDQQAGSIINLGLLRLSRWGVDLGFQLMRNLAKSEQADFSCSRCVCKIRHGSPGQQSSVLFRSQISDPSEKSYVTQNTYHSALCSALDESCSRGGSFQA